ncbi:MAG: hypothetical protein QOG99_1904 [Frankiales bacterium]|nr:hypothetical protein [Frankiales bacterium]
MSIDVSIDVSIDTTRRILVITDRPETTPELQVALRSRAEQGSATFHVLVTNPARAEYHLLHPERHDAVARAEQQLGPMLEALRNAVGAPVDGCVSIRHDAFEAVEEHLLATPADELVVAVASHELSRRLHHDLPHRLDHLHLPMTVVGGLTTAH